ncbi:MAG: hypothetical protein AAGA56_20035, partial [Myxococcota bacterium]
MSSRSIWTRDGEEESQWTTQYQGHGTPQGGMSNAVREKAEKFSKGTAWSAKTDERLIAAPFYFCAVAGSSLSPRRQGHVMKASTTPSRWFSTGVIALAAACGGDEDRGVAPSIASEGPTGGATATTGRGGAG